MVRRQGRSSFKILPTLIWTKLICVLQPSPRLTARRFWYRVDHRFAGFVEGDTIRTGAFDTEQNVGAGSLLVVFLERSDAFTEVRLPGEERRIGDVLAVLAGERLETRLVDGVFWQELRGPGAEHTWVGRDIELFGGKPSEDTSAAVDGRVLINAYVEALRRVEGVAEAADDVTLWSVEFDGDEVSPGSAPLGMVDWLVAAGFNGVTGVSVPGVVTVDRRRPDEMVGEGI